MNVSICVLEVWIAMKCVVFMMGRETYGMEIARVKEILHVPETITRMPESPDALEGVFNLRDMVVPILDLKKIFGLGDFVSGPESRLLVFDAAGSFFAILVDAVKEVLDLDEGQIERVGAVLPVWKDGMVRGIGKQDGRLIILLDAEAVKAETLDAAVAGDGGGALDA